MFIWLRRDVVRAIITREDPCIVSEPLVFRQPTNHTHLSYFIRYALRFERIF
jgi:hypothetical protein